MIKNCMILKIDNLITQVGGYEEKVILEEIAQRKQFDTK